ncbi:MAG TPA: pentapeptide repeat-containing protein [Candidatus Binatia bacterium]|nr:pentapeptide repeat-containing protein [Candidatus Binatia bacterium]
MIAWQQEFITIASALAAIAINALWQDALLVLCVWLLLKAWPRVNAATRYTVWSATLVAAFIVPVATTLAFFAPSRTIVTTAAQRSNPQSHETMVSGVKAATAARATERAPVPAATQAAIALPQRLRLQLPIPLAIGIFVAWVILATYALVRLAIGLVRLEQLKRDALPLPVEYRDAMPQWLSANKGARDVRLCVSDETDVPVAVGLFDAMILVPRSLLDRLSHPEVDQICLHELAHLRRADDWTNGMQRLINALLGWNPAAIFAGQQLDLEREVACDDWVVSFVHTIRPYALCLTKMAETATWPRQAIPAPGVFATRKHISLRIERLLGAGRNMATNLSIAPTAAAIAVVGALALAFSLVAPSVAASPVVAAVPAVPSVPTVTAKPVPAKPAPAQPADVQPAVVKPDLPLHIAVAIPATKLGVTLPRIDTSKMLAQTMSSDGRSCSGCNFAGVDWSGRDKHGVSYLGVDLSGAKLIGTNFSDGNFSGVDFSKADLHNASFRGAHLVGCDFSGANLSGVDFTGARLSGCQFTGARLTAASLRDVLNSCSGCDFTHANLSGADLSNVRANGDDFTGADLRGANFSGAQLTGMDFTKARMDGANFSGATLSGCDLSGVDLTRVDLSKAKLIGMDLTKP